jgi:hypothetical protein
MMVGPEQHVMTLRSAARADLDPYLRRAFF